MKYRDHMNLGTLIYLPLLSKAYLNLLPSSILCFVPFLHMSYSSSWIPTVLTYFFYSIGCCLPDIDLSWYPDGGHRVKSPMHNMSYMLLLYITILVAGLIPAVKEQVYIYACITALVFGCIAHLCGDMIQGGVGWGFKKRKKRLGFSSFRWNVYAETYKGSLLSIGMAITAFIYWGLLLKDINFAQGSPAEGVFICGIIWLYSVVACRSYHRYLGSALTAIIFIVLYKINKECNWPRFTE